ncbi:sulfotransferase [Lyngbya sp. CCY1209]|jgi:hypothetical protein|uniref:sulfotransferase family protein n=1 Tax=Lyngbya sp. CCY1209 TaxID=2886103 RepID=UPI002D1FDBCB|nr:sulfotransferase [Lyngbya sp. CCY1209]MEB3887041.1 sulfotransferase [Lyngbya sp. CCY1209]
MNQPNFFIVGAAKCGTTALSNYLSEHPNIYISRPKEPRFFAEEFQLPDIKTWEQYLSLFEDADGKLAIGEASVHYLCSATAIEKIYHYKPDAKIIVMLRNPVDVVYSYHSQLVFNQDENEVDFEKAWRLQDARQRGEHLPPLAKNSQALQYRMIGKLGSQVEKLLSFFSPEQVKIILFDDFQKSTKCVYEEVLSFLEVPSDNRSDFPRINANKKYKNAWLARLTDQTPPAFLNVINRVKKAVGLKKIGIVNAIRKMNYKEYQRHPLMPTFRSELVDEFREEVIKLENILNQDLGHWKQ